MAQVSDDIHQMTTISEMPSLHHCEERSHTFRCLATFSATCRHHCVTQPVKYSFSHNHSAGMYLTFSVVDPHCLCIRIC